MYCRMGSSCVHGSIRKSYLTASPFDDSLWLILHTLSSAALQTSVLKKTSSGFRRMLSLLVKPMLCLPSQVIVRKGEAGHKMFFVQKGLIEVCARIRTCACILCIYTVHRNVIIQQFCTVCTLDRFLMVQLRWALSEAVMCLGKSTLCTLRCTQPPWLQSPTVTF